MKRALTLARAHPGWTAAVTGLVLVTLLAALPIDPEGPYDARTYERVEGFRLEFPVWGALVEPLAAPGHAIAGAPDLRVAAVSTLVWIFVAAAVVALLRETRRRPRREGWLVALRSLAAAAAASGVFLVYVAFAAAVRLPSWRLVREDGTAADHLVVELQTHTFGSHDGVIGARDNLEWHRERGFDVVAVTEHDDATGSFKARDLAAFYPRDLPAVIPGVEIRSREGAGAYLLALGLDMERGPVCGPDNALRRLLRGPEGREDLFCEAVHRLHRGAVLALAWKLGPDDVRRLAEAGVDGFEIANAGHPDVPLRTRAAMLEAARKFGLVLVASSDWHGWGGFWRTWTVVCGTAVTGHALPGGLRKLPPRERAEAVVTALRERRAGDVVPLVAGYVGPPSVARAILSPPAEALRYACELSAARVAAWWVWAGLIALAASGLRRRGLRPGRTLLALLLLVFAAGLVWQGGALMWAKASGETSTAFPGEVGLEAVGIGVAAFAAAVVLVVVEVLRLLPAEDEQEEGEGGSRVGDIAP